MEKLKRAQVQTWLNSMAANTYYVDGAQVTGVQVREYFDALEMKLITLATAVATKEESKNG